MQPYPLQLMQQNNGSPKDTLAKCKGDSVEILACRLNDLRILFPWSSRQLE